MYILNDPANYPIFIHCRSGADRTGAMVALYRIAAQDWDGKKAVVEAREIGMRWWYFGLKDQIQDFAKGKNKSPLTFKPSEHAPIPVPAGLDSPTVYRQ